MTLHGNSCQSSLQKIQLRSAKYVHYVLIVWAQVQHPQRADSNHLVSGSNIKSMDPSQCSFQMIEHNRLILPPGFCLTRSLFCQAEVPSTIHGELRGGELPFGGVAGCKGILSTRHSQQLHPHPQLFFHWNKTGSTRNPSWIVWDSCWILLVCLEVVSRQTGITTI